MNEIHIKTLKSHLNHWKRLYAEHICEEKEGRETIEALRVAIKALQTQLKESLENFNKDSAPESMFNADLISRQAVIDACNQSLNILEATERIKDLPAMKPEQKVGHWIYIDDDCELYDSYECSKCKRQITVDACRKDDIGFVIEDMEFCPRCGARMLKGR